MPHFEADYWGLAAAMLIFGIGYYVFFVRDLPDEDGDDDTGRPD